MDIQTLQARKSLGVKYGAQYGIDATLICALCEWESGGWMPWAIRYEPLFYSHYIQPLLNNGTIHNITEAMARATSWGLMQVMGQTAREFGFTGHLASLCDPDIGIEWGCKKLRKCLDLRGNDVKAALLAYNGGGDVNYPFDVMPLMAKYA
jgi:hypothetical protein